MTATDTVGLDTGVFRLLLIGDRVAEDLFERLVDPDFSAVVSCITLYELRKLRHRGVLDRDRADALLEQIPAAFEVVWIEDADLLDRAAGLSHGNQLPMADALILASCLRASCRELYTTDRDFSAYEGEEIGVRLLD